MKHIGIFCFSGTGNTAAIGQGTMAAFDKEGYKTSITYIDSTIDYDRLNLEIYDMIGVGFPVYGMGAPRIMGKFIRRMPNVDAIPVFIFMTAADNTWVNDGASWILKRRLGRKGYDVVYERLFVMPSNFYLGYDDVLSVQLYKANLTKIKDMVHDLKHHVKRFRKSSIMVKVVFSFINWCENNFGARAFGLSLKANEDCTECGICIKKCPMGNISFKKQAIKIGADCTFCMRCVYTCPQSAIETKMFRFTVLDEPYDGADIVKQYQDRLDISLNDLSTKANDAKYQKRYKHFEHYLKNPKL